MKNWILKTARLAAAAVFVVTIFGIAFPVAAQQGLSRLPGPSSVAPPSATSSNSGSAAVPQPGGTFMSGSGINDYVLGVGDKVQITVFGEDDLSGMFEVSSTGTISMPLIGEVHAAGQTSGQVQKEIIAKLSTGYMKDPHVSLQVSTYRPFFIVGEVMKPGSYTYVNGMTVINAVALAGGYTYRADKDDMKLKHGGPNGKEEKVEESTSVQPGDVITVPERFF